MTTLPILSRAPASTAERRWRAAALIGLVVFLAVVAVAAVGAGSRSNGPAMVQVLRATRDIRPGTTITADELGVTSIRADDSSLVATLVRASDRDRLVGQVAAVGVSVGHLVPDNVAASQVTAGLWETNLPVRRMPADLHPGDHIALVVNGASQSGQPTEFVVMQDVQVIGVASGAVDLWLPPKVVAQMDWYSNHGGIAVVKMQPGAIQQNLPAGGGG